MSDNLTYWIGLLLQFIPWFGVGYAFAWGWKRIKILEARANYWENRVAELAAAQLVDRMDRQEKP